MRMLHCDLSDFRRSRLRLVFPRLSGKMGPQEEHIVLWLSSVKSELQLELGWMEDANMADTINNNWTDVGLRSSRDRNASKNKH
jgi:hypothetical protein